MFTLESLPPKLLRSICEYLFHTHLQSLRSFSLVNRKCHATASPLIYRNVVLWFRSLDKIGTKVRQCRNVLERHALEHVHSLLIGGKAIRGDDSAWLPLAHLIRDLPALTDVKFYCWQQFPICLLVALDQREQTCRLHVGGIRLFSLRKAEVDSYEWKLATSSHLYSVRSSFYYDPDRDREAPYSYELLP